MLPEEAIQEFKVLYKKRFGVELSDAEAKMKAEKLVRFYAVVLGDSSGRLKESDALLDNDD